MKEDLFNDEGTKRIKVLHEFVESVGHFFELMEMGEYTEDHIDRRYFGISCSASWLQEDMSKTLKKMKESLKLAESLGIDNKYFKS